ncbi:alanine racemase [bacterium]|nr:alanine racemase [bacterium]
MESKSVESPRYTAWAEVDLEAIRHNYRHLKQIASSQQVIAIVKSEAYGHGLEAVASALYEEGAWGFGVVSVDEAERLRAVGITSPIIIIAPLPAFHAERAIKAGVCPAVYDLAFAQELSKAAERLNREAEVHIKIDTGMGRLSLGGESAVELALATARLPHIKVMGIYSHLANADCFDQSYTMLQVKRFRDCIGALQKAGLQLPWQHLAASAGLMALHNTGFNLARAGISLYGLWPSHESHLLFAVKHTKKQEPNASEARLADEFSDGGFLRPALSFKALVMQVKQLPKGSCVSYGCTFTCRRDTTVAVLPVGYADGVDRHLSNCGEVLIGGQRAPIVGRVCMNLCMADITDIPGVAVGDEAVLIGSQGSETISADEVAARIGTINYEVVTRLPMHIPRVYLNR